MKNSKIFRTVQLVGLACVLLLVSQSEASASWWRFRSKKSRMTITGSVVQNINKSGASRVWIEASWYETDRHGNCYRRTATARTNRNGRFTIRLPRNAVVGQNWDHQGSKTVALRIKRVPRGYQGSYQVRFAAPQYGARRAAIKSPFFVYRNR